MVITNAAKERLRAGKPIFGVGLTFPSPATVELCAYAGFDFVRIDCEHGPMDPVAAEQMVRAAEASGITPFARTPTNAFHEVLRLLDAGVLGVLVPHIESRAEAEAAAKAMRYYPEGERGMAGSRWARYGSLGPLPELIKQANAAVLLMTLIESAKGVENLEEIVSVPGVDVVWIGHNDLSQSLGVPAQVQLPIVQEHIDRIIKIARAANKPVAMLTNDADGAKKLLDRGVQIVEFGATQLFMNAGRSILGQLGR
ncbi:MAG: aldolase/citrate lyase family protein [Chloroflexi bacterium]|nr:aldolase/citrate lyase family protein [Chloroflexota bacterium]